MTHCTTSHSQPQTMSASGGRLSLHLRSSVFFCYLGILQYSGLVYWALKTNNHSSQRITWISESDIKQQGTNSKLQICTFDKPCQSQICTVRKYSFYNYICSLSQGVLLSIGKNLDCLTDYVTTSVYSFRKSFYFHKVVRFQQITDAICVHRVQRTLPSFVKWTQF